LPFKLKFMKKQAYNMPTLFSIFLNILRGYFSHLESPLSKPIFMNLQTKLNETKHYTLKMQ
jgi:hypothetical protein